MIRINTQQIQGHTGCFLLIVSAWWLCLVMCGGCATTTPPPTVIYTATATATISPTPHPLHGTVTLTSTYPTTITSDITTPVPLLEPLRPVSATIVLERPYSGTVTVQLYDATMHISNIITTTVTQQTSTHITIVPRGALGAQQAVLLLDGTPAGVQLALFVLDAHTHIATGDANIDSLYPRIRDFMQHDVVSYTLNGERVRGYRSPDNPLIWLRDYVYQMQGFRYFEPDVTSTLNAFQRAQYSDGSFPDVLTYPQHAITAHRLDAESDLEYLFVQGVFMAWQATGDDAWLMGKRDAMKRGIDYITSSPLRWDTTYQLVRRPYTIDMWDFQYGDTTTSPDGKPAPRHWIDDNTVWGFFHGDTTGLAYAIKLLERIERHMGNSEYAEALQAKRDALMAHLNALSWQGGYFTHFVLLDGTLPVVNGVDTAAQVSLSNAYALNREILTFEQGRAILETYHKRRDFNRAFAEWYSIDPPFPTGTFGMAGAKGERLGEYVNGGIMPLVGGELARGAFRYGAETYGFDILQRYAELIKLTGASYLWYYPNGRSGISSQHTLPTDGWGASAMLAALIEGAAGVVDKQTRFTEIELAPRWAAHPTIQHALVTVRYAASDGYVAYQWHYHPTQRRITLDVTGSWQHAHVRLLLPPDGCDTKTRTLTVNGIPQPVYKRKIGSGQYIQFDVIGGNALVDLQWTKDEENT